MDGQQHFSAFCAFYGIELRDRKVWVFIHKIQEILVAAPGAAPFVHLIMLFGPAF